ncbi:hypothetical protein Taro_022729 [Colocasia esculenta]|uniref:Uncharacterized protein n=1 Tax=Colocasia esculenta TaxID=4460 RepID=A0A843V670_COLES|nr:hypothetical protein [Colocasia esculenta]
MRMFLKTDRMQDMVVSIHPLLVSTQCFKHKAKYCRTGQVVSTLDQVVSTLETAPKKPVVPVWDSVSTLDQVVSKLEISGLMQSEVEEDHVFPSRSPHLQRSKLAAHDPNLLLTLP